MKKSLIALLLSIISLSAFTQEEEKSYPNEIGIDVIPLLENIFQNSSTPNYSIGYRYYFNKVAIRAGLGGYYHKNQDLSNNEFAEISSLNGRLGIEFFNTIDKRSTLYYGIDITYALSNSNQRSEYEPNWSELKSQKETIGITPLFGYRFKLNDRLSLGTETKLNLYAGRTMRDSKYNSYPYSNSSSFTEMGIKFLPPTSLSILIRL